jgi:hypothetical protein
VTDAGARGRGLKKTATPVCFVDRVDYNDFFSGVSQWISVSEEKEPS